MLRLYSLFIFTFISIHSPLNSAFASTIKSPLDFFLSNENIKHIDTTQTIEQHGITWYFSEQIQYGKFANGDYWVVDPGNGVKITKISPGYTTHPTTGRAMNGSMTNPNAAATQGYDGYTNYDQTLNAGFGISPTTPLVLSKNVSLVSTISNLDAGVSNKPFVNSSAVLTCLASPPPMGSFRPGVSSMTKTLHNVGNIDYTKLKSLNCPIEKPDITIYAKYLSQPWLDHMADTNVFFMHATTSGMDKYYFPSVFSQMALMLNLNYTNEEKKQLLINYIQLGIDIYSTYEAGSQGKPPNGGHMSGRKFPVLFAGVVLGYSPMVSIWEKSGDYLYSSGHGAANPPLDYIHGGNEDGQTFYVSQSDIDITSNTTWVRKVDSSGVYYHYYSDTQAATIGTPPAGAKIGPWRPDTRNTTFCNYTATLMGMPEWGIVYSISPQNSDSSWGAYYRNIGTGAQAWAGTAMAVYIMGLKSQWNHNAHFDYVDRYMAITAGRPDPFGYTVKAEAAGSRPSGLIGAMWDTYRKNYQ